LCQKISRQKGAKVKQTLCVEGERVLKNKRQSVHVVYFTENLPKQIPEKQVCKRAKQLKF
jgi:hypothetical protein